MKVILLLMMRIMEFVLVQIYLHHEDLLLDDGEIIPRLKLDHL